VCYLVGRESEIKERILMVLEQAYPLDLSVKEVAKRAGVSKETASKYIAVLEAEGRIECRHVGRAKLCRAKK